MIVRPVAMRHLPTALRRAVASALLSVVALLSACSWFSVESWIREQAATDFSHDQSCPYSRLLRRSFDVRPEDVFSKGEPPADIATDPERAAVWNESIRADLAAFRLLAVVDLSGCGAHQTYLCWVGTSPTGDATPLCSEVDLHSHAVRLNDYAILPAARESLLERLQATVGMPVH